MPWTWEGYILRHYLVWDKIIQNCLKMNANNTYDYDLFMREKLKKKNFLEADIKAIKKHWFAISSWKDAFFKIFFKWPPLHLSQLQIVIILIGCIYSETPGTKHSQHISVNWQYLE